MRPYRTAVPAFRAWSHPYPTRALRVYRFKVPRLCQAMASSRRSSPQNNSRSTPKMGEPKMPSEKTPRSGDVSRDALNLGLIGATQLDHVPIGIAHEH